LAKALQPKERILLRCNPKNLKYGLDLFQILLKYAFKQLEYVLLLQRVQRSQFLLFSNLIEKNIRNKSNKICKRNLANLTRSQAINFQVWLYKTFNQWVKIGKLPLIICVNKFWIYLPDWTKKSSRFYLKRVIVGSISYSNSSLVKCRWRSSSSISASQLISASLFAVRSFRIFSIASRSLSLHLGLSLGSHPYFLANSPANKSNN